MILIKVLAVIGVIVGIYYVIEDQLDINLNSAKMEGKDGDSSKSGYLESVTGASLDEQLIEVLLMISSCLKAGRNLDQAFELVAVSTPPPICNEFRTLVQERRLGVPMVEALQNLGDRVPSQDLRLAVNATIFQQETGGNLEDLYTQILLTISERRKIMGKIVAGTAHARLSGNLVATIPVILAIVLLYLQPDYLTPMLENSTGLIALLIAMTATIVGVVFINKITSSILPDADEVMVSKNESTKISKKVNKLLKLVSKPFVSLVSLIPQNITNKLKNEIRFLLNASGKSNDFEVDEFIGLMALSMILFGLFMILLVSPARMGIWAWLVLLALLPIGFKLPRIYLAHLIRKRQKNIEFELPYVIDLLSLAIESGLDLTGGIAKVVEKSRNTDIVVEFKMFLADIKVGKSMEEALADMAERVKVLSFFSFVSSLIQAQRLGADIGPTLRAQAEQMRYQRLILAEEKVNKLPVKLLIPLVFFVFPSISVLLIGPAIIQIQTKFPKPDQQIQGQKTSVNKKIGNGIIKNDKNDPSKVISDKEQSKTIGNNIIDSNNTKNTIEKTVNKTEVNYLESKNNGKVQNTQNIINTPVVKIEKNEVEPTVETVVPVVPNVTPAPIVITEPVNSPKVSEPEPVPVSFPDSKSNSEELNSDESKSESINQSSNEIKDSSNENEIADSSNVSAPTDVTNEGLNIQILTQDSIGNGNKSEQDLNNNTDNLNKQSDDPNLLPIEVYISE